MLRKILKNTFFFKQAPFLKFYLTETWFDDRNSESSLCQLTQYTANHQYGRPSHKSGQGGGIRMHNHGSMNFKSRRNLDINIPNRVTKNTANAIDHIITNSLLHRTINAGVIKLDI